MSQKQNRWILNVVLVLAAIAFVGFSMIPLIGGALREERPQSAASPSPGASTPAPQQAELESQARGYELVLQREPDNQTALKGLYTSRLQLGQARLQQGETEKGKEAIKSAVEPLEKLSQLNPGDTRYNVLLAQVKQYLGDREGAAQVYRTVLTTKPGDMNALQGLVGLLVEQNRPEAAVGLLQDTLKTASEANQIQAGSVDTQAVQLLLGAVYADQKRFDEAIAVYDEMGKANSQDFRPVLAKALILKEQGKTEEAKPLFAKAESLAPAQYKDQINQQATGKKPTPASPNAAPTQSPAGSPTPAAP